MSLKMSSLPACKTLTYDAIRHLQLQVYIPDNLSNTGDVAARAPVVVWFHGGGLITGGMGDLIHYLPSMYPTPEYRTSLETG